MKTTTQFEVYEVTSYKPQPNGDMVSKRVPLGRFETLEYANVFCNALRAEVAATEDIPAIHFVRAVVVIPERTAAHIFDPYTHTQPKPDERISFKVRAKAGLA